MKSVISQSGDSLEREADRIADRIVGTAQWTAASPPQAGGGRLPASRGGQADLTGMLGNGHPLDPSTRAYFEPRFAHDFAQVRVFDGPRAAAAASGIRARAFTVGCDVAFAAGEYLPHTGRGRHLLAHELTHVVQQSAAAGASTGARGILRPGVTPAPAGVIYRAEPDPGSTASTLPFERVGNDAGTTGARHAATELEGLLSGPLVSRALATIPITDAGQKAIVVQHVLNAPATLRAIAEAGKVRALSREEHQAGVAALGFPGLADAFADTGNDFLYITPHGRPSAWTLGHEVSHIQTGPVPTGGADPELVAQLWGLNTEVRAAFVDYAVVKLGDMRKDLAAGKSDDEAVAAFKQRYAERIFDYVARHGSVSSALKKLADVVSARRGVASVPTNTEALKRVVAKGIVDEADLAQIYSQEVSPFNVELDPLEIEGL